jgi:FAD/FMN-containing dehydrogenase
MRARGVPSYARAMVYRRGEEGYEDARRAAVWNARKPDRRPDVIVKARSEEDVVAAVRDARASGLRVAVRSGGHNWFGASVRDDGMLLDLSELSSVEIDPAARSAAVQPSVRGGELAAALGEHDLAFPVGHCDSVAMGGYLLAAGLGWNFGSWGPACFSVRAVEVVRADGELVTADADENRELFWLARGSGIGFPGVVTRFHLAVFPRPRAITASTFVYPAAELDELAGWVAETRLALPPWIELIVLLASGRAIVSAVAFVDSHDDAVEALAVLETAPVTPIHAEPSRPAGYEELFAGLGAHFLPGHRYQTDTMTSQAELRELLGRAQAHLTEAPSPKSFVLAVPFLPPPAGALAVDAAFSPSPARAALLTYAVWEDEADDAPNVAWSHALVADVEPLASSFYVGETDLLASPDRVRQSFSESNWLRINELRVALDPEGRFHSYP